MPSATEQRRLLSQEMHAASFSARTLDAGGALTSPLLSALQEQLALFGALHVQHTGLHSLSLLEAQLPALGFGPEVQFSGGGRTSHTWQPKWVGAGLRRLDYYPPDLYLLPNNEVQYQRFGPERILFFCLRAPAVGGRTFLHSAQAVEQGLRVQGAVGQRLLQKLEEHGLMIETGFLDGHHPCKGLNYFQSWQERFQTPDPEQALALAREQTDQYDHCWFHQEASGHLTLMTRITLSAFKQDPRDGQRYLRFPRLALGPPALENGYRRYPLGNGEDLSAAEQAVLLAVYLDTREGTALRAGDLVLFDNVRYGHSRESFSGEREVYVGMAGLVWDDRAPQGACLPPSPPQRYPPARLANPPSAPERYTLPDKAALWSSRHSMRTFDAGGALTERRLAEIRAELARHGAVLVQNTGLCCPTAAELPDEVLAGLGFGGEAEFLWGGLRSGRTARRRLSHSLRATDDYPPERWLLPHNEILYQRQMPARLLFFSAHAGDPSGGGRTFVHEARRVEDWIRRCGPPGAALLAALRTHGYRIEMGFLDAHHPLRHRNYFRAWQERFDTPSRAEAMARCRAARTQFDDAWWKPEADAPGTWTLMTRITIPAYAHDPITGQDYLFFPRIALDGPQLHNGYRRFPLGNGEELSEAAVDMLLGAFLATREGVHYAAGDILLVDNVRYGHSRESFQGTRELGVAMAGEVWTDDAEALGLRP